MAFNFIRRTPLEKKPRAFKISAPWRQLKVRLDAKQMGVLRGYIWDRSNGQCENAPYGERCTNRVGWRSGEMAHMKIAHTRSDSKESVLFVCHDCHDDDTRNRNKLKPHKEWMP